ncbi:MAG: methyltransferase domain-containing protein [Bryobacterales bacterium]|nr:methyltransferase domain-containing protein [Bryobacterales bacterium]
MRYYGDARDIDYTETLRFFEDRGRTALPNAPETSTMYQQGDLARQRDQHERATVEPLLGLHGDERVLDIGCGYGRWARALSGRVHSYLGLDFSQGLLRLAQSVNVPNSRFQCLPAQQIEESALLQPPPFDLFLCSGILIYLNDADVSHLAQSIAALASQTGVCYLREPMAVSERLTLDRFPSAELNNDYSAIYRTAAECHTLFGRHLENAGFTLTDQQSLYPPELCNRRETEQWIYIWRRSS